MVGPLPGGSWSSEGTGTAFVPLRWRSDTQPSPPPHDREGDSKLGRKFNRMIVRYASAIHKLTNAPLRLRFKEWLNGIQEAFQVPLRGGGGGGGGKWIEIGEKVTSKCLCCVLFGLPFWRAHLRCSCQPSASPGTSAKTLPLTSH